MQGGLILRGMPYGLVVLGVLLLFLPLIATAIQQKCNSSCSQAAHKDWMTAYIMGAIAFLFGMGWLAKDRRAPQQYEGQMG